MGEAERTCSLGHRTFLKPRRPQVARVHTQGSARYSEGRTKSREGLRLFGKIAVSSYRASTIADTEPLVAKLPRRETLRGNFRPRLAIWNRIRKLPKRIWAIQDFFYRGVEAQSHDLGMKDCCRSRMPDFGTILTTRQRSSLAHTSRRSWVDAGPANQLSRPCDALHMLRSRSRPKFQSTPRSVMVPEMC